MNTILSIICVVLNSACAFLICYFLSKWMQRIEYKIDSVRRKQSIINVHCLNFLKIVLDKNDQTEQANKITELIEKEMNDISLCSGFSCPLRNECKRYLIPSSKRGNPIWWVEPSYDKSKKQCELFIKQDEKKY